MNKPRILKIGGSLLSHSEQVLFDFNYFYKLKAVLKELTLQGETFVVNVGGGYAARKYQQLIRDHGEQDILDVHRVGVAATNLNAEIVHGLLDELATKDVLRYDQFDEFLTGAGTQINFAAHSIQVAAASQPGKSNDWNSLQMALSLGVTELFNLKNIDGVYDSDPAKFPDAKLIPKLTWDEYLDIIGNPREHEPGASYPIDPIAARQAQAKAIKFIIISGDTDNLKAALAGGDFHGSVISD